MNVQSMQLEIVFHIEQTEDGYSATFDSPVERAYGIPFSNVSVHENQILLEVESIRLQFEGTVDNDQIIGKWKQSGAEFDLVLTKEKIEIAGPNRPQEPTRPLPYREEEVRFTNSVDEITLAGTLTMPQDGEDFPAVILISGSGPQDRDETFMTHKPFLVLADHLTRNGIAVLRFDDRGFGESEGDHSAATSLDFATDVEAAVEYLLSRSEINKTQIGLAGHSEGGLIAPIVTSRNKDVSFMILLAGPGVNGLEIQKQQVETFGPAMGLSEELIKIEQQNLVEMAAITRNNMVGPELENALIQFFNDKLGEIEIVQGMPKDDFIKSQIPNLNRNWNKYFIDHEPSKFLSKIDVPTLAISGEKDIQVTSVNLEFIERAFTDKSIITVKEYPGMNHFFQECNSCLMSEYAQIEETFSEYVMQDISEWIHSKTDSHQN